jgi:hypothetical protein
MLARARRRARGGVEGSRRARTLGARVEEERPGQRKEALLSPRGDARARRRERVGREPEELAAHLRSAARVC